MLGAHLGDFYGSIAHIDHGLVNAHHLVAENNCIFNALFGLKLVEHNGPFDLLDGEDVVPFIAQMFNAFRGCGVVAPRHALLGSEGGLVDFTIWGCGSDAAEGYMFDSKGISRAEERAHILCRADIVQYDHHRSFCLHSKLLKRWAAEFSVGNFSHCCETLLQSYEKSKKITTFEVDLGGLGPKIEVQPMMKRVSILLLMLTWAVYVAQGQEVACAPACGEGEQEALFFDGEVATHFDNAEYAGNDIGYSRTIFAVKLTPALGYRFGKAGRHAVVAGAELLKDFGSKEFLNEARLLAYYRYKDENWGAYAGAFKRDELIGHYSRAFFSDSTLIYNGTVQGVAGHYCSERMFAELSVDWNGLYSPDTREEFRVLASVGGNFAKWFNTGVSLSLQHYANKSTFRGNVVDNALINPWVGAKFNAFFDFDVRLGYLQAYQRDRRLESGTMLPKGGELYLKISRWGAYIDNNLYVGENLMPLYDVCGKDGERYAEGLYTGDIMYRTNSKIYNRTGVGYERKFSHDRVSVKAELVLQYTGQKVMCSQLVGISAKFAPTIYDKSKHKK